MCSVEIPVREDERGNEGPEVEPEAQPAGAHLHPNSRHAALHGLGGGVRSEGGHRGKRYNLVKPTQLTRVLQFIHVHVSHIFLINDFKKSTVVEELFFYKLS